MQKALIFATPPPPFPVWTPPATVNKTLIASPCNKPLPCLKAVPAPHDASTVDYNSNFSVFPAEACETIGGDACDANMCPEAKLKPEPRSTTSISTELTDREYLDYDGPKTVFLEEACDELGGEFCDPEYQK